MAVQTPQQHPKGSADLMRLLGWKLRTERERRLKVQGRDPISLERGKCRRQSLYLRENHGYRVKAARGANSHIALKLQTEKLVLRDRKEEQRSRGTLQEVTLNITFLARDRL